MTVFLSNIFIYLSKIESVKNLCLNFFYALQDEKAIKVELDIQIAIQEYIVMECPQCNEAIFQGQRGMFVCRDNPHWPTYRITLNDEATSFIQEWVCYYVMSSTHIIRKVCCLIWEGQ